MTVILRDAMVFLSKDVAPLIGSVSYDKPLTANTPLTIETNNHAFTKQAKLLVCKLTSNAFGFIVNGHTYLITDKKGFDYLNKSTRRMLGHELKACFTDENSAKHELI